MRAAVLTAKERLEVEARDDAPLAAGEVRVRIANGGICGSDLHYFHHYRMGDFPVIGPFVLGHEGAGTVAEIGPGVSGLTLGDTVAVNPSQACGDCECCRSGRELLCSDMRFIGSSRRTPHMQGLFTQHFVTPAAQCVPVGNGVSAETAAFAEPLSVALHAAGQAGPLLGRSVLITGSGPIGSLICIAVRLAGARHVTMADVLDEPLKAAEGIGADRTVNLAKAGDGALIDPARPRGHFDVAFDASGHPDAVVNCLKAVRPDGVFVQVGMFKNPMVPMPVDLIMAKELTLKTSYRFDKEFAWAVQYLSEGRVDVSSLLTHRFPLEDVMEAFQTASDRTRAMKVQLVF
jgi:L-idonate 5-dehydrogenase